MAILLFRLLKTACCTAALLRAATLLLDDGFKGYFVPAFLVPSLCIAAMMLVLLLALKTTFRSILPGYGNILLAVGALLVECACLAAGVILDRHYGNPATPWIGKLLALAGLGLFVKATHKRTSLADIGLCTPRSNSWWPTLAVFAALLAMNLGAAHFLPIRQELPLARVLFMALVSGSDEEIVFRGLMPSLLRTHDKSPCKGRAANALLVFSIPTIAFALMHAWRFHGEHFVFAWGTFAYIAIGACGLMYVRLRSGSLLNSLVLHNLTNVATAIALSMK